MKIKRLNLLYIMLALMTTITIVVTYYVITSNSVAVPKSATLVKLIEVNKNG